MQEHILNPEKWVDLYSDYLFNYTIPRVNDRVIAQDIVSETFLAGLKSAKNFKGQASERTWLISILKRKIIDYYRKINSKKGKAEVRITYNDDESEGDWLEQRVADPLMQNAHDKLVNAELGDAIMECLEKLPKKQMEVFRLRTIDDLDTETISQQLDITSANFWVIMHRARKSMAKCLNENWFTS